MQNPSQGREEESAQSNAKYENVTNPFLDSRCSRSIGFGLEY